MECFTEKVSTDSVPGAVTMDISPRDASVAQAFIKSETSNSLGNGLPDVHMDMVFTKMRTASSKANG